MPSEAQNTSAIEKNAANLAEQLKAQPEKMVSLNEDSKSHEHDEASFNKLFADQQKRMGK
jgi:hypothetical protein